MFAFSATSSLPHERFINNCIVPPSVLKFKSEYELLNGVSPVSEPKIVPCHDRNQLIDILLKDLDNYFEKGPIVIVVPDNEKERFILHMNENK